MLCAWSRSQRRTRYQVRWCDGKIGNAVYFMQKLYSVGWSTSYILKVASIRAYVSKYERLQSSRTVQCGSAAPEVYTTCVRIYEQN